MTIPNLQKEFESRYGYSPDFLGRAPGRVNLIGEHTDYNGFPVMPLAIPYMIHCVFSARTDSTVNMVNTDTVYEDHSFYLEESIPHSRPGHWSNYVKAAAQSIRTLAGDDIKGIDVLYSGDIPGGAGLSSSSALVIVSALALITANSIDIPLLELAEMMADAERYVGTQGGGMDQAASLLGRNGHALKIDFFPLRTCPVKFPDGYSILVAHSLIHARKTENALMLYNMKPAECRLATAVINAVFKPDSPLRRLGDLPSAGIHGYVHDAPESFVDNVFDKDRYTLADVCELTGKSRDDVIAAYLMTRNGKPMPEPPGGYLLRQRTLHVLTEALRVMRGKTFLPTDPACFGMLMDESHASCDINYGISTEELNVLSSVMRRNGARGARLTGAGFGGCVIGLVSDRDVEAVADSVWEEYFLRYLSASHPEIPVPATRKGILFSLKPSTGADVHSF